MYLFFIFYAHTVIRINFVSLIFNIFTKIWKSPIFLWCPKWTIIHKSTSWPGYGPPSLKLITVPKRELNLLQDGVFSNKSFNNWRKYGMGTERTAKSPIFLGVTVFWDCVSLQALTPNSWTSIRIVNTLPGRWVKVLIFSFIRLVKLQNVLLWLWIE